MTQSGWLRLLLNDGSTSEAPTSPIHQVGLLLIDA
jgi:hypothetical protein